MTTYQALKKEGRVEGEINKARLMILRGKWKGATADFLVDQSELSFSEVEKLLKGYDKAYKSWKSDKKTLVPVEHLTEQEVQYLFDLFEKK